MKKLFILLLSCCFAGWAFSQNPPAPPPQIDLSVPPDRDADPKLIHAYNMYLLEKQAGAWTEIAAKTLHPEEQNLYNQLAASFLILKAYREEYFLAEEHQQPFHYEKKMQQEHQHQVLLDFAVTSLGEKAPVFPPEVTPKRNAGPATEPTPVPKKSYTTESGFEVKLKLEE